MTVTSPDYSGTTVNTSNPAAPDLSKVTLDSLASDKARQELSLWATKQFLQAKSDRSMTERQWYLNMAFYFGRQNVQVLSTPASPNGFKLWTPPAPPWRVRLITNKIRSTVRTELARLTSQKPTVTASPASGDEDAIVSARAAEDLFEAAYRDLGVNRVIRRSLFWMELCGSGFTKEYWDANAWDAQYEIKGTIKYEAVSPFYIFVPDLREEEIENEPWVIHASAKTPEWVNYHYANALSQGVINPSTNQAQDLLQDSFLNMIGSNSTNKNSVLCLEVWIKPGAIKALPNGGMFTVLGDTCVQIFEGWPYGHKEYPFEKIDHIPSGKFYGDSPIVDMIPLQREYNRTRSQIIEAKNLMSKPKLLAPKGSINANQITSEPGQVIYYQPGLNQPTPLQIQPLPEYVLNEVKQIQADMDDISGQSEVVRGQTPPQNTSAQGFAFLQEQADVKLQSTYDSIEAGLEKFGRHYLALVKQYWNDPRIVKVLGPDGTIEAQEFTAKTLGKVTPDLKVEAGSALPTSKAARYALIMDMMKMGIIPPDKGLDVLELGGLSQIFNDMELDKRQARRENLRMQVAQEVPVNEWDNHQAHIQFHDNFRKTQQFENLDPAIKQGFDKHVELHKAVMSGGNPAAPGQPPVGGPPNPGGPPQPGGNPGEDSEIPTLGGNPVGHLMQPQPGGLPNG